ncbi:MAG TPA: DUF2339 domain-containing protein [Caulobacteraceae bacterium]|nr:DUF2339 domain-containing protein [Caulobacteraceae bacterium]
MVWLALIGLGAWMIALQSGLGSARRELEALRRLLSAHGKAPVATGITPAMALAARVAAEAAMPVPPTIVPETVEPAPPATPAQVPEPVAPLRTTHWTPTSASPPARPPSPAAAPLPTRASVERWLAEKGLAWIGGSALVVGGAFLVGYAAQRGLFTPQMRILAATVLGFALGGAGELIRRRKLAGFGENPLAGAILTGAGAAVLYGASWAAHDLYHFIGGGLCAGLLATIAAALLALAFVHGEALAVLAIGGAFAVPMITGGGTWGLEALTAYLGLLIAGGAATGWARGWPAALWATLAGAGLWAAIATGQRESLKALLLGLEPLAVLTGLAFFRARPLRGFAGVGAVVVASLATFMALTLDYPVAKPSVVGVIAAITLPALIAAFQRRGQAPDASLAGPAIAFTLAAAAAQLGAHQAPQLTAIRCMQIVALDVAGLWAAWRLDSRITSGVAALGSLALALIGGVGIGIGDLAPIGPAVACLALALGAARLATDRARPTDRPTLEIWGGASAAALLATIAVGLAAPPAAAAFALAAVGLALAARRLKWRSIAAAAAAAAGLGLAALLTPTVLARAIGHAPDAWLYLGAALLLAAASFVAARLAAGERAAAEALRTLSPLAALTGAFVFLRWIAGGGEGRMDALTEASIRTLLIGAAGLASLAQPASQRSRFASWRGHLLMAAAALHGFVLQALSFNPRFGLASDEVLGPPLLDNLAVAFAAPALLFGVAAARTYREERDGGRIYAALGLASALLWAFEEIRRLAFGVHIAGGLGTVGAPEAVGCSLALLALAAAAARLQAPAEAPSHPLRQDLTQIVTLFSWVAVGFALVMTGLWSNPCWGAGPPVAGWPALICVFAGYSLIAALIARLALDAGHAGRTHQAELAADGAILAGLVLAGLVVRAAFHGLALGLASGVGQLETWSYSAVAAVLGLAFVGVSRRGGRMFLRAGLALLLATAAKVFVIDTASLSGVVRAGSFLALGVLLLLGALTARRIAGRSDQRTEDAPSPSTSSV